MCAAVAGLLPLPATRPFVLGDGDSCLSRLSALEATVATLVLSVQALHAQVARQEQAPQGGSPSGRGADAAGLGEQEPLASIHRLHASPVHKQHARRFGGDPIASGNLAVVVETSAVGESSRALHGRQERSVHTDSLFRDEGMVRADALFDGDMVGVAKQRPGRDLFVALFAEEGSARGNGPLFENTTAVVRERPARSVNADSLFAVDRESSNAPFGYNSPDVARRVTTPSDVTNIFTEDSALDAESKYSRGAPNTAQRLQVGSGPFANEEAHERGDQRLFGDEAALRVGRSLPQTSGADIILEEVGASGELSALDKEPCAADDFSPEPRAGGDPFVLDDAADAAQVLLSQRVGQAFRGDDQVVKGEAPCSVASSPSLLPSAHGPCIEKPCASVFTTTLPKRRSAVSNPFDDDSCGRADELFGCQKECEASLFASSGSVRATALSATGMIDTAGKEQKRTSDVDAQMSSTRNGNASTGLQCVGNTPTLRTEQNSSNTELDACAVTASAALGTHEQRIHEIAIATVAAAVSSSLLTLQATPTVETLQAPGALEEGNPGACTPQQQLLGETAAAGNSASPLVGPLAGPVAGPLTISERKQQMQDRVCDPCCVEEAIVKEAGACGDPLCTVSAPEQFAHSVVEASVNVDPLSMCIARKQRTQSGHDAHLFAKGRPVMEAVVNADPLFAGVAQQRSSNRDVKETSGGLKAAADKCNASENNSASSCGHVASAARRTDAPSIECNVDGKATTDKTEKLRPTAREKTCSPGVSVHGLLQDLRKATHLMDDESRSFRKPEMCSVSRSTVAQSATPVVDHSASTPPRQEAAVRDNAVSSSAGKTPRACFRPPPAGPCAELFGFVEVGNEREALASLSRADLSLAEGVRDPHGLTILHCAAAKGLSDLCRALLDRPDFREADAQAAEGWTALHYAALTGHVDVCSALLEHARFSAADLGDGNGHTALHYAAAGDYADVCKLLVRHPRFMAESARTCAGCSALDVATGAARQVLREAQRDEFLAAARKQVVGESSGDAAQERCGGRSNDEELRSPFKRWGE